MSVKHRAVIEAKSRPCADCSHTFPSYVMQFDHLPGFKKLFNLGEWKQHSLKEIRAEIAKCAVVCANCHAIRTWKRSHGERLEGEVASVELVVVQRGV